MLFLNEDGNISFEPCEAGILDSRLLWFGRFRHASYRTDRHTEEQQNENQNVAMTVNMVKETAC